jgi:hypothetical protein
MGAAARSWLPSIRRLVWLGCSWLRGSDAAFGVEAAAAFEGLTLAGCLKKNSRRRSYLIPGILLSKLGG